MPHGISRLDRRAFLKSGVAAGTLASVAGCLAEDPEEEEEFVVTLSQFPDTIDPLDHITGDYFDVYDHIYEPLFDFEPGEGIFARVVEDWEAQGDGTTWCFTTATT